MFTHVVDDLLNDLRGRLRIHFRSRQLGLELSTVEFLSTPVNGREFGKIGIWV